MSNRNRKTTSDEVAHAQRVIREAYPDLTPVFGGHGNYGGRRAPRDHTFSFRLRDAWGQYHSNVVWILPQYLAGLTVSDVRHWIAQANGKRQ